jgi:hypothetical protein
MRYTPGARFVTRYSPSWLVVVVNVVLLARFTADMLAFWTTRPVGSVTVPTMDPVTLCAKAIWARRAKLINVKRRFML